MRQARRSRATRARALIPSEFPKSCMRLCTIHRDSPIQSTTPTASSLWCIVLVTRQFSLSISATYLIANSRHSTGYGAHGDYLFGWKDDALQRAMDALGTNCWSETCPALQLQSSENAIGCTKQQQFKEDIGADSCRYSFPVKKTYTKVCFRARATPWWHASPIIWDKVQIMRRGAFGIDPECLASIDVARVVFTWSSPNCVHNRVTYTAPPKGILHLNEEVEVMLWDYSRIMLPTAIALPVASVVLCHHVYGLVSSACWSN